MDRVHTRELIIEGIKSQETSGHTHIVSIASEGRTYNQHDGRTEEGIAPQAQIWLQAHNDN